MRRSSYSVPSGFSGGGAPIAQCGHERQYVRRCCRDAACAVRRARHGPRRAAPARRPARRGHRPAGAQPLREVVRRGDERSWGASVRASDSQQALRLPDVPRWTQGCRRMLCEPAIEDAGFVATASACCHRHAGHSADLALISPRSAALGGDARRRVERNQLAAARTGAQAWCARCSMRDLFFMHQTLAALTSSSPCSAPAQEKAHAPWLLLQGILILLKPLTRVAPVLRVRYHPHWRPGV